MSNLSHLDVSKCYEMVLKCYQSATQCSLFAFDLYFVTLHPRTFTLSPSHLSPSHLTLDLNAPRPLILPFAPFAPFALHVSPLQRMRHRSLPPIVACSHHSPFPHFPCAVLTFRTLPILLPRRLRHRELLALVPSAVA
jgi:hypothetical protein